MPLTRHLYREDEVAAALMFCILRRRSQEAVFWCLELLDSGLAELLLSSLRCIWLYGYAATAPIWFQHLEAAAADPSGLNPDRFLALTFALSRTPVDATVLALLGCRSCEQPDRINLGGLPSSFTRPEAAAEFFTQAVRQRKIAAAWGALRGQWGEAWELLGSLSQEGTAALQAAEEAGALGSWEARAAALVVVCSRCGGSWELPELPPEMVAAVAEWRAVTGRRQRRLFTIPIDCLYWVTARGREISVYDSTEKELMGRLEKPTGIWNSGYWDEVAEEFGGWEAVRSDDAVREAFYEREFPDDRPDEWSKADRAKSHGCGVMQRGSQATAVEWLRRWFGSCESRLLWNGVAVALETLKKEWAGAGAGAGTAAAAPQTLLDLWSACPPPFVDLKDWNLRPVKQRILSYPPAQQQQPAHPSSEEGSLGATYREVSAAE